MVAGGLFIWCSVNILAKRLRDIGFTMAYNTAILYTVIDTLLMWRTDYLIVDLMSFAVTILIILVPSGYLTKKNYLPEWSPCTGEMNVCLFCDFCTDYFSDYPADCINHYQ
ncbi:hypothetical protein ABN09_13090 [Morganella morganii]|nr:hypothetical protein ABN09_13090 [Morganella morganii]